MILNNFCKKNPSIGADILNEWTGIAENPANGTFDINKIRTTNKTRLRWNCSKCGNQYIQATYRRIIVSGCPVCNHSTYVERSRSIKLNTENNLYNWCINNPDKGDRILNEWTGIDIDNNKRDITEVSYGSTLVMYWKCQKCGNIYSKKISYLTINNSKCDYCINETTGYVGSSYAEEFLYHCIKQIYPGTKHRVRVLAYKYPPIGLEFDIIIPEKKICIEYNGTMYHTNNEFDRYKRLECKNRGLRLITIRALYSTDKGFKNDRSNEEFTDNYIKINMKYGSEEITILKEIVVYIIDTIDSTKRELVNFDTAKQFADEFREKRKDVIQYNKYMIRYK